MLVANDRTESESPDHGEATPLRVRCEYPRKAPHHVEAERHDAELASALGLHNTMRDFSKNGSVMGSFHFSCRLL